MNNRNRGYFTKVLMLALVACFALPAATLGQRNGRRRAARHERHVAADGESQLNQTAKTAGYNSGKQEGINDRKRGEPSNFHDESAYQKATKGYTSALGDKEHYKQVFRESFEHGYRDGWNGY